MDALNEQLNAPEKMATLATWPCERISTRIRSVAYDRAFLVYRSKPSIVEITGVIGYSDPRKGSYFRMAAIASDRTTSKD